ncbi:MAG: Crp/Fnr family transcriptional regulator [Aphanothece sp. CMT-3BRIN-NPC111]|jgi:CRP-like cAMP-binding protein|nr:Crp/Fnr family transcriptional regulator [Aphanothece sp. CMT-3BRIN-NPC111]
MQQKIFDALNQFVMLSLEYQEELIKFVVLQEFPKDTILLKVGEVSNYLHFLAEGSVRAIYYQDSKEVTSWFGFEGDFITSFYSFVSRKPSPESIILISDCKLLSISYKNLQFLYDKDLVWNKLGRLITEHYYVEYRERILSLQSMSAAERYDELIKKHPNILDKVKLGHLASYLGITQETLSRLRATRKNRHRLENKLP